MKFRYQMLLVILPAVLVALLFCASAFAAAEDTKSESTIEATTDWPDKIGPFELTSADGESSIRFGLAAQLMLSVESTDLGKDDRELDATVQFRRIRPSLKGSLISKKLTYYLHLSTAPNALEFLDFYINYAFQPYLQFRVGQWKLPITRYRINSFKQLPTVDWTIVTKYFGSEREIGFMLHSGNEKPEAIEYAFGVFSGPNARKSHAKMPAGIYGEKLPNRSDLASSAPTTELHPELVGRLAYNHGDIDLKTTTDFKGGGLRYSFGIGSAWDIQPDQVEDWAARLAPEILVKFYNTSLQSEFYLAWADTGKDSLDLGAYGAHVQLSYLAIQRIEFAVSYAVVKIEDILREAAENRARRLIVSAEDDATRLDLEEKYGNIANIEMDHELIVALTCYIIGNSLKWQNDFGWLVHDTTSGKQSDYRFRSQLALAF